MKNEFPKISEEQAAGPLVGQTMRHKRNCEAVRNGTPLIMRLTPGCKAETKEEVLLAQKSLPQLVGDTLLGSAQARDEMLRRILPFLETLRRQKAQRGHGHAQKAYDLTLDKILRYNTYLRAYLNYLESHKNKWMGMTELERDMFETELMRGLLRRHFYLSLNEVQRSGDVNRFVWRLSGGTLTLRMPRSLPGRLRRQWLDTHVPGVDPARPGEQARVQSIIDAQIGQPLFITLPEVEAIAKWPTWGSPTPIPGEDLCAISVEGLAETVAEEKARLIAKQRPAIRALGPAKLAELIRRIFEALADDQYCLVQIAQQFGISQATLSRFAGIRWKTAQPLLAPEIPDLWLNSSQVLGGNPDFVEAAKRAGVWERVAQVAQRAIDKNFDHSHES